MNWTLVHQVWQLDTAGRSPPFSILVKPVVYTNTAATDKLEMVFKVRNDANFATGEDVHAVEVVRGQWNRFTLQLQPSLSPTNGQIAIWMNKATTQVADRVWYGAWGYAPSATVQNQFDFRVGLYRRQQPRRLKVIFDDIRLGPTGASVDQP